MNQSLSVRPFKQALLLVILLLMPIHIVSAQLVSLDRMPVSVVNQPDFDLHDIKRPGLSVVGFDNTEPGYNPAFGYGLKQILDLRYNQNDPTVTKIFDRIIEIAHQEQANPYNFSDLAERRVQLDTNTNILQCRAFEALVTFVLELNGYTQEDLPGPVLRSHEEAMVELNNALINPPGDVLINGLDLIDDFVRYGRSLSNVARTFDLYLALENAYFQYLSEANPFLLPTEEERIAAFEEFGVALITADFILATEAVDVFQDEIDLPPDVIEQILMILEHRPEGDRTLAEVEPGNWALKQRTAIGYGTLAMQALPGSEEEALLLSLLPASMNALDLSPTEYEEDRLKHWNFMTYGGKRFWAESTYYLDWSMEQVMPFFHTIRANGKLNDFPDPFFTQTFTNPLHWLTDTVTPDAFFMPLDDGNKAPVRYCGMMNWPATYGDAILGRKCAWIEEQLEGPARRDEVLLVELAIPNTFDALAPASRIGNYDAHLEPNLSEQQLILREGPSSYTHYLVMNGEHDKAVDRGEGHEQPDQLQILYFLDDLSYLMDSGYDRGFTVENSTWNHYYDHNVLTAGIGEGGLRPPMLRILEVRKASEPRFMGEVEALYMTEHENVTVLHGEQVLNVAPKNIYDADYTRDVLFVNGTAPYLIDFNQIIHQLEPVRCDNNQFQMNYHVNSNNGAVSQGNVIWHDIGGETGTTLTAYPVSVEFNLQHVNGSQPYVQLISDRATERQDGSKEEVDMQRLTIYNPDRCESFWSIATVLQANTQNSSTPTLIWTYNAQMPRQGWIWQQSNEAFDVFIARSPGFSPRPIRVNPYQIDTSYPDIKLELASEYPYGFARLTKEEDTWVIDDAYQVYLTTQGAAKSNTASTTPSAQFKDLHTTLPSTPEFLGANPNPFNPTTTIRFSLPEMLQVRLTVYDMLGRQVRVLIDDEQDAGEHTVHFEAGNLSSGTYLLRLETPLTSSVQKVILIK